ncbi:ribonuclease E inhibitor RraA/Dimethylmenaquinone methyltransferase [Polychytrium aggregatum]|uniref:ribonuclease E inhibitor RraA/Dimethylmenaquinone methyltransferase n=1 Tax=Polychytrium aggregatum TaxID=110093 RepID=UPI0022FE31C7|nr:ribonuclease E inhibitor RraA/Dimethylmenaquinone methyltransferase [Polychytrium aggregatum]KAI9199483.1 ribonuclease E inhibitor RraA/Dimethylmenaquinone methyltransferase [Polychytrium aggregatum]
MHQHEIIALLEPYTTCDLSDGLAKLGKVGHLPGLSLLSPEPGHARTARICGPAFTIEHLLVSDSSVPPYTSVHPLDLVPVGSVLVIKAPAAAPNAVFGGLMATRAQRAGSMGALVEGRIRDLREFWDLGFSAWALGHSTMGAAGWTRLAKVGEPVQFGSESMCPVWIRTGDIIVADVDGAVRIPIEDVELVAKECAARIEIDRRCMRDLTEGKPFAETLAKHR